MAKPVVCKLLRGTKHYFATDRGFSRSIEMKGGNVPISEVDSMDCGFLVRPGCEYEARLSADIHTALQKMARWEAEGKYVSHELAGKCHVEIFEKSGDGRETKVGSADGVLITEWRPF